MSNIIGVGKINKDKIIQILQSKKMKITSQRKAIIDVFEENADCLLTINELEDKCKKKCPEINLATIYRNIELFINNNFLYKVKLEGKEPGYKFICYKKHHHHLICIKCGKSIPFEYCPVNNELEEIIKEKGFTLSGHLFEIYGICDECKKKSP